MQEFCRRIPQLTYVRNDVYARFSHAAYNKGTALRELGWALEKLPPDQREALFMIVLQEKSYEDAAEETGCAIGTLKSRVHRARLQLRAFLMGDVQKMAA